MWTTHDSPEHLKPHLFPTNFEERFEERFVSYLPLSHIAAQAVVSCSNFNTFFSTLFNSIKEIILRDG